MGKWIASTRGRESATTLSLPGKYSIRVVYCVLEKKANGFQESEICCFRQAPMTESNASAKRRVSTLLVGWTRRVAIARSFLILSNAFSASDIQITSRLSYLRDSPRQLQRCKSLGYMRYATSVEVH